MDIFKLYDLFVKERRYLKNVSPHTLDWYKYSFKAFAPHVTAITECQSLRSALKTAAMALVESKRQPSTINDYIRAVNAFLHWASVEGHLPERLRLDYLKEEQKIIPTFSDQHIKLLLAWKPRTFAEHRMYVVVCLLLDTGLRISEAVGIRREEVDFDNLLITVKGKGGKHRALPFSFEMRKVLFRWLQKHAFPRLFPTIQGSGLNLRNLLRDFKWLQNQLGITGVRFSPHTFRHSFAVHYLRRGGNVLLGHSTLEMTNRYARSLGIADLQAVHDKLSLLTRR
jgi:integrase/recombinase XerD